MISHTDLLKLVSYDNESGTFFRKTSAGGFHVGTPMGRTDSYGYKQVTIQGKSYLAHRLAWFYVHNEWPKNEIDHINGNRLDNRIANLRVVDRTGNNQNLRNSRKTSITGVLGISPKEGKYQARIGFNGKQYYLGFFASQEDAHAAYVEAKRKLHSTNTL